MIGAFAFIQQRWAPCEKALGDEHGDCLGFSGNAVFSDSIRRACLPAQLPVSGAASSSEVFSLSTKGVLSAGIAWGCSSVSVSAKLSKMEKGT